MKVLIVVIVILVVLMVAGIALGARNQSANTSTASAGWPARIGDLLVRKQPLSQQDIQAAFPSPCSSQLRQGTLVLPPGDSCQFAIRSSRTHVRGLTLQLQQGTQANIHLELYGENKLTSDIKLEPGEQKNSKDVQFFREGGAFTITCLAAAPGEPCRIAARQPSKER